MYYIGVDLGQRVDYTAIAVVERVERSERGFDYVRWMQTATAEPDEWVVRSLERVPLGTPYPRVVERLDRLTRHPRLAGSCRMVVDATGVGAPVVDLLRTALVQCPLTAVTLTAGEREGFDGQNWRVPKVDLYTRVQVLLEQERLRVAARVRESEGLRKELLDVRGRHGARGRVRVGADGCGEHDDLVMAVALAVWAARERTPREVFVGRSSRGEARRVV